MPCGLFLFERNYALAPYNNMVIGFKNKNKDSDINVVFDEQVLGVGTLKFKLHAEDIANVPQLKIK